MHHVLLDSQQIRMGLVVTVCEVCEPFEVLIGALSEVRIPVSVK